MATTKKDPGSKKSRSRDMHEKVAFTPEDLAVMDAALDYNPELRLSAGIAKVARKEKLKFPLKSAQDLLKLMPKRSVLIEGHHLHASSIETYMRKEYFPIADERELIARCYLALVTCREQMRWAASAPETAQDLIKEYKRITQPEELR